MFTIPVCDVGAAVGSDFFNKDWILQNYGHESRPVWCGNVCGGDEQKTMHFIKAANMEGFKSAMHLCPQKPGWF
ncbi:hypothetical protein BCR34DRAFT_563349 [Clohesyomyces aquaticus]|uniref:Uncharacterized protein n=1 Tax=Clohesyomyces aquaticus TaxID=1231657 RepID=A0A1Y1ZR96_9PLEO|nr:hypothetical protein BCR34DRAFT_563349 [Clohesyomyces aquaticus]